MPVAIRRSTRIPATFLTRPASECRGFRCICDRRPVRGHYRPFTLEALLFGPGLTQHPRPIVERQRDLSLHSPGTESRREIASTCTEPRDQVPGREGLDKGQTAHATAIRRTKVRTSPRWALSPAYASGKRGCDQLGPRLPFTSRLFP